MAAVIANNPGSYMGRFVRLAGWERRKPKKEAAYIIRAREGGFDEGHGTRLVIFSHFFLFFYFYVLLRGLDETRIPAL